MIRFVYIVGISDNPVKVGVADDVNKRLSDLQISCPEELVLHHAAPFPNYAAGRVEAGMHKALKEHHRRGEWFNVSAEMARLTMERIAPAIVEHTKTCYLNSKNVLDHVHKRRSLSDWGVEAIGHYKERLSARDGLKDVKLMDRVIVAGSSSAALVAFKAMVVNKRALGSTFYRDPAAHQRASHALSNAINALSMWYAAQREKLLLDEISGNAA